ncbi:hypothetical protein PE36_08831 [Moritella sp. PE36]|nr:hypothetical protein PE36_08831 [Moritella sp. PE36]
MNYTLSKGRQALILQKSGQVGFKFTTSIDNENDYHYNAYLI